jgi:hypothetical protein
MLEAAKRVRDRTGVVGRRLPKRTVSTPLLLKAGKAVTRKSWNGMAYLLVQVPDKDSKMPDPYIYMVTGPDFNIRCPYSPNQTDLLTSEWVEA